jgi:hypothetical protein
VPCIQPPSLRFYRTIDGQVPISPDCVFDASLVPETCLERFCDFKGLINKFLESRNRKLEIQRTAALLLCGCDFVGDFAVAIEELNNRHAIGVDAQDEAIASVGILDA